MNKKLLIASYLATLFLSGAVFAAISLLYGFEKDMALGFAVGVTAAAVCMIFMYLTAVHRGMAAVFYFVRVSVMFGSVLVSAFIPAINGVGVVVPLIIHIPAMAAAAAISARKKVEKTALNEKGENSNVQQQ